MFSFLYFPSPGTNSSPSTTGSPGIARSFRSRMALQARRIISQRWPGGHSAAAVFRQTPNSTKSLRPEEVGGPIVYQALAPPILSPPLPMTQTQISSRRQPRRRRSRVRVASAQLGRPSTRRTCSRFSRNRPQRGVRRRRKNECHAPRQKRRKEGRRTVQEGKERANHLR